jgi:uncharacterized membrane protein YkoI
MLLIVLSAFVAGFCAGWVVHSEHFKSTLLSNPSALDAMLKRVQYLKAMEAKTARMYATTILANYEQHGKMWYLFAADDDQFLGQGLSEEEALENAREKYPGVTVVEQ